MSIALEDSRLARHLDAKARALLVACAERREFATGGIVFEEGSNGDGLYVVERGEIEIAARSVPGRLHRLAVMGPGDYFGEMAVFDGGNRSATAIASGDVSVFFIPARSLLLMLESSPLLAVELVREGSRRMRDFNRRFLQEVLKAERLSLVERLAKTIVHDFRNPLNVIGLAADVAAESDLPEGTRKASRDRIRRQIDVLNRMMQELLDFTRGMTPSVVLPKLDYRQVIADALEELEPEARRRGIEVVGPGTMPPIFLRVDALRLHRVFTNLFQNAFDALADHPKPRITLRIEVDAEGVVTEVSDNGPGIAAEVLAHVFQPFVTFGKAHGTGLGLAISDRIVAEHGGSMEVGNQQGCGACFRFTLPHPKTGDTDYLRPLGRTSP